MSGQPTQAPPERTVALFAALFALGSIYLASLAWFLVHGRNFVDAEQAAAATRFAESTRLALPATLTFERNSEWSKALSTGWHRPESGGVWSSRADATIVLPALADPAPATACFAIHVGTMSDLARWPMLITIDGQPLAPKAFFSGKGSQIVRGNAHLPPGALIQVRFTGPGPRIPNLIWRHTTDPRGLAYWLLGMTITRQCSNS